jgi:glucose-1-phosphate thymidylyltransferase
MKGILLAGGDAPALPGLDRPAIDFPLSLLLQVGVRDILIAGTPQTTHRIKARLGGGAALGVSLRYQRQETHAVGEVLLRVGGPCCVVNGGTFLTGEALPGLLREAARLESGAIAFAAVARQPERHAVVEVGPGMRAVSIEEQPEEPRSPWALTGLSFYGGEVGDVVRSLGDHGAVTGNDINRAYLARGRLGVAALGRGVTWVDMGAPESRLSAALLLRALEADTGERVACLEGIALEMGYISAARVERLAVRAGNGQRGRYLRRVLVGHSAWAA